MENKKRVVVKFKDETFANLTADSIVLIPNSETIVVSNESAVVGVFNASQLVGMYMSEKKEN